MICFKALFLHKWLNRAKHHMGIEVEDESGSDKGVGWGWGAGSHSTITWKVGCHGNHCLHLPKLQVSADKPLIQGISLSCTTWGFSSYATHLTLNTGQTWPVYKFTSNSCNTIVQKIQWHHVQIWKLSWSGISGLRPMRFAQTWSELWGGLIYETTMQFWYCWEEVLILRWS